MFGRMKYFEEKQPRFVQKQLVKEMNDEKALSEL